MRRYRSVEHILSVSALAAIVSLGAACASAPTRFPLREPVWRDPDLDALVLPCHPDPTKEDPKHVTCAPEEYVSPLAWDAADNTIFRPLAKVVKFDPGGEAPNVNSLDEVPDSAWFTNRLGKHAMTLAELRAGACPPTVFLDGKSAADGSWVIDKGKANGSSPGFRVKIPGKGKFLFKADSKEQPERPSAASVIGAAVYHATGFHTSCEQVVYFKRSALKLTPGLTVTNNTNKTKPFDQKALDAVYDECTKDGPYIRMQASSWLPGKLIGPFRYEGTRSDDPNDRIPHEDRRDLRGGRLVAAWLDHFDAREQNSMDSWIPDDPKKDTSPGHVVHYYLDTSDCLGSEWDWEPVSRRLGHSYLLDFDDVGLDLVTLGIPERAWDRVQRTPGQKMFGFIDVQDFSADGWKNEYPNPTFSRMTEHDGAWMARILARFTPEMVKTLADMGQFSNPSNTAFIAGIMEGRLEKILERYLTRLSPLGDVAAEGDRVCATDLAWVRNVRPVSEFKYSAAWQTEGGPLHSLVPSVSTDARICVTLPHAAPDGGLADDAAARYVVVRMANAVARGQLEAHLYDLGPRRGFRLAGLKRPDP